MSCLYVVVLCEEDCNYSTWDAMHSHTLNALTHPPVHPCRDLHTGTTLCSFKAPTNSAPRAATLLGREYFASCQSKKPIIHFWDFRKEQVKQKSFVPEKCWSVACTSDGALCAAGGESGSLHVWDTSTGALLVSFPAHHKRITAVAWSDGGTELVAGSDDSLVTVWSLSGVMETVRSGGGQPRPLHTFSDHTMPVSALVVGAGVNDPYIYTCSLDHRLTVRSLVSGRLLASVTLPSPLTSLAVDPLEYCAYMGSNNGCCYKVSFVGEATEKNREGASSPSPSLAATYRSQSGQVTCLALSKSGQHLVMGTEDGAVLLWDTLTGQQIRKTTIDQGASVSALLVLASPHGLAGRGRGRKAEEARPQPLSNFTKVVGSSGCPGLKPWMNCMVVLTGGIDGAGGTGGTGDVAAADQHDRRERGERTNAPELQELQDKIKKLQEENALLSEQKSRAMSLLARDRT